MISLKKERGCKVCERWLKKVENIGKGNGIECVWLGLWRRGCGGEVEKEIVVGVKGMEW